MLRPRTRFPGSWVTSQYRVIPLLFLAVSALLLSIVSAALAVCAVMRWRQSGGNVSGHPAPTLVVAAATSSGRLDRSTLKAVAASAGKGAAGLAVGRLNGDAATRVDLEDVNRQFPGFPIYDVPGVPDGRHVMETALSAIALSGSPGDPVLALSSGAMPSTPVVCQMSHVVPSDLVCSCFPARPRASSGWFSASSDVSRLTPITSLLFGPPGVLSGLTLAGRDLILAALKDPLSLNRPGLGSALHFKVRPDRFRIVPYPVPVQDDVSRMHIKILSRLDPGRSVVLAASVLAGPLSLFAVFLSVAFQGRFPVTAVLALAMAVAARLAVALTWQRQACGMKSALLDALVSPVADAPAFFRLIAAFSGRQPDCGGVRCQVRAGGLVIPARPGGGVN